MANKILPNFPLSFKLHRTIARFWSRIDISTNPDECWEWTGFRNQQGYGQIYFFRTNFLTHRLAWWLDTRRLPDGDVLHSCDNPACCNPNHLRLGTPADNARDRVEHGVHHQGSAKPCAILTEVDVVNARTAYAKGAITLPELAEFYGVSYSVIYHAVSGRAWKHVPMVEGVLLRLYQDGAVSRRGEGHRSNRLSATDVFDVAHQLAEGVAVADIARAKGVHCATISDIKHGRTWKHLQLNLLAKIGEITEG